MKTFSYFINLSLSNNNNIKFHEKFRQINNGKLSQIFLRHPTRLSSGWNNEFDLSLFFTCFHLLPPFFEFRKLTHNGKLALRPTTKNLTKLSVSDSTTNTFPKVHRVRDFITSLRKRLFAFFPPPALAPPLLPVLFVHHAQLTNSNSNANASPSAIVFALREQPPLSLSLSF